MRSCTRPQFAPDGVPLGQRPLHCLCDVAHGARRLRCVQHHIAQINIARMKAPLDSPVMEGFVSRLAEINALADASPGFVWRLQTPEGDATYLRPFDDDRILINMDRKSTRLNSSHIPLSR